MSKPDSPQGYTDYQAYDLPSWWLAVAGVVLVGVAVGGILLFDVDLWTGSVVDLGVGVGLGLSATLFLHESLHYLAGQWVGYDPTYDWPNTVYVTGETIGVREISVMLLAPQLLSVVYAGVLWVGAAPGIEVVVGSGFILAVTGGFSDIPWTVRRWTWPTGTRVIVTDSGEEYVAFPEN